VVSRRALLEENCMQARRVDGNAERSQVVHGHVKNVTEYGAFVDSANRRLLHLTDLSWGRVKHPSDVVKPEQEVDVIILSLTRKSSAYRLD